MLLVNRQLQHAASWDQSSVMGGAPKLNRDSKNFSMAAAGGANGGDATATTTKVIVQPSCPPEPPMGEVPGPQEVIGASSSDYSNSEDEYTHIEEPTPVSD